MKTFEERYTAWLDGRLEGNALAAFEQELLRRASGTEAQADRTDAGRLRMLLRENLQAPALTNADFFSLQIRQRIEAERASSRRPDSLERGSWLGWFAGPVTRVIGLGAAAVFVAGALYYGMVPPHSGGPAETVARTTPLLAPDKARTQPQVSVAAVPNPDPRSRPADNLMAKIDPPAPEEIDDESPGFAARVPDPASTNATATPLHYRNENVNVLWVNGLDYMTNVPQDQPVPPPAGTPVPASAPAVDSHHG